MGMKNIKRMIWCAAFFTHSACPFVLSEEIKEGPIARVFDNLITVSDISPEKETLDHYRAQLGDEEINNWKQANKIKALEALIYSALQKQLLEETGMEPSEDEIQLFIDFSLKQEETRMEEFQSQRDVLLKELQS